MAYHIFSSVYVVNEAFAKQPLGSPDSRCGHVKEINEWRKVNAIGAL